MNLPEDVMKKYTILIGFKNNFSVKAVISKVGLEKQRNDFLRKSSACNEQEAD